MKMNWGTGIAIFLGLFIIFILYFVVRISTSEFETQLVTEDYYGAEMLYQREINAEENLKKLTGRITTRKSPEGLLIQMPADNDYSTVSGYVTMYRPSDNKLDFKMAIELGRSLSILVPKEKLLGGRWDIIMEWQQDGETYMYKEKITY